MVLLQAVPGSGVLPIRSRQSVMIVTAEVHGWEIIRGRGGSIGATNLWTVDHRAGEEDAVVKVSCGRSRRACGVTLVADMVRARDAR